MNPANGLKVKAYKDAMNNQEHDHELVYVARCVVLLISRFKLSLITRAPNRYLLQLVNVRDFTMMDHSGFKKTRLPLPPGVEDPAIWLKKPQDEGKAKGGEAGGESSAGPSGASEG
jgi:ubiquitin-like domain-containing CTD phosphatase 1